MTSHDTIRAALEVAGNPAAAEYRIEYSLQRSEEDGGGFTEIGFGSSGAWGTLDAACHMLTSAVTNYCWETEGGQPDPDEIRRLDALDGGEQ